MGTVVTMIFGHSKAISPYRIQKIAVGEPGWRSKTDTITVPVTKQGVVASCRCEGDSAAVYTSATAPWAVGSLLSLYGILGALRVGFVVDQAIIAGTVQAISLPAGVGGIESLEVEVSNPPVGAVPMRVVLVSWDAGSSYWDARFVELLDELRQIKASLKSQD